LGPNILLNIIPVFGNTLSLRSSLNMSDQVSHPYNITGRISNINFIKIGNNDSKWFFSCYWCRKIKKNEMGAEYSTDGERRVSYNV